MRYRIELDIPANKGALIIQFLKSISFVKKLKIDVLDKNEITNPDIIKSIEEYESKKVQPTPLSLEELKAMINA